MAERREVRGIHPYDGSAGGWDALRAVVTALRRQETMVKGGETLLHNNHPEGFDCPGCAWPDPKHTSSFEFCENGAKAVSWEATKKRATPEFFTAHTVSELWTWPDIDLEGEGRLTHPFAYDPRTDRYVAIEWDEAFQRIGAALRALPDPNMAEFYTSGRASNEAAFLFQLFARAYGTNNFPDCSNMCHEATSVGLPMSIGVGKGTVTFEDFDHADAVFSFGHNPGTNHPRMMTTLRDASRRGAAIIVFNPLKERALERFAAPQDAVEMATFGSTPIASALHQVRVGGDVAVLKGMMKRVLERDAADLAEGGPGQKLDRAFIAEHTTGFEALKADLDATDWAGIEAMSGLTRAAIESAGDDVLCPRRTGDPLLWHGLDPAPQRRGQRPSARQLPDAAWQYGPSRGRHLSVARPLQRPGRPNRRHHGKADAGPARWDRARLRLPRARRDRTQRRRGRGGHRGRPIQGADLSRRQPGGRHVRPAATFAAMRRLLTLAVHLATKLNRSHLLMAKQSFILPVLGRTELDVQATGAQAVTVEDSMSMVHASRGRLPPASEQLRSEPFAIVAGLAKATAARTPRHRLGRPGRRLRPHPRRDRGGVSGLPRLQRPGPPARRVSVDRGRLPAGMAHADRQGGVHHDGRPERGCPGWTGPTY